MRRTFVEHTADQSHHRHVSDEMFGKQLLARVGREMGKVLSRFGQHQVAFTELRKAQQLEGLAEMKDFVGLELELAREHRQVGMPVIGRSRQRLDQAGQHVGRDVMQRHADPGAGNALDRGGLRLGALGHAGIDVVDELAERRIEPVARVGHLDLDLGGDAARIGREHQDAIAHQDRLLDVVRHHQHGLDRQSAFDPEIDQSVRSVSAVSTSSAENGSSISSKSG